MKHVARVFSGFPVTGAGLGLNQYGAGWESLRGGCRLEAGGVERARFLKFLRVRAGSRQKN